MLPWLLCGALALLSLLLLLRLAALHRSLDELRAFFAQNIAEESNGLIRLSSRDPYVRRCASGLNAALRELREQRHAYLSGDRELKNAVVNVSHDLRTPLTAICGYVELLEREELSPDAARYVAVIGERAEAMRTLCEELFRYSLVSSEDEQMHPEVLSLSAALQESFAAAYTMLKERGITPEISLPETDVQRTLDRAALMRIFSNLLSNAAKYSDGDLRVTLSADGTICFENAKWAYELGAAIAMENLARTDFSESDRFERVLALESRRMRKVGCAVIIAARLTGAMVDIMIRMRRMGPTLRLYLVTFAPEDANVAPLRARLERAGIEVTCILPEAAGKAGAVSG